MSKSRTSERFSYIKNKKLFESDLKSSEITKIDSEDITNEDMLAPSDSPTFSPNGSSPGELFQTPMSMPADMDTFSLLGPGKKKTKKKKSKKEKDALRSNPKVLKFTDFLNNRK